MFLRPTKTYLFVAAIMGIIIVVVIFALQPSSSTSDNKSSTDGLPTVNAYLLAQAYGQKDRAERTINETQGKAATSDAYEHIVSGVVTSAFGPDTVYFATSSSNPQETFVGVYLYEATTRRWQRLFKKITTPQENKPSRILRVVGATDQSLILLEDEYGRKMSRCESLWLTRPEALISLSLENPYAPFQPYALPESLRTTEQMRVAECLARP